MERSVFLFVACAVVWLGIAAVTAALFRAQKRLEGRVSELEASRRLSDSTASETKQLD
jgi:CcmD family protein